MLLDDLGVADVALGSDSSDDDDDSFDVDRAEDAEAMGRGRFVRTGLLILESESVSLSQLPDLDFSLLDVLDILACRKAQNLSGCC